MDKYDYSQLNNIIALQYAKQKNNNTNWFLEDTIKYAKGYTNTSSYLNTIAAKITTSSTINEIDEKDDPPLYLEL